MGDDWWDEAPTTTTTATTAPAFNVRANPFIPAEDVDPREGGLGRGRGIRNKMVNRDRVQTSQKDFEKPSTSTSSIPDYRSVLVDVEWEAEADAYELPKKGRGGGGGGCYKCGEEGHTARDCPTGEGGGGGGGGRSQTCYNCGQEGHMSRDCANERKEGVDRPQRSGGGPRKCYNCGEEGHMSRDCQNERVENVDRPQRREGGGGFGGNRKSCFRCGAEGHMVRDCTEEPTEKEKAPRPDGGIDGWKYVPPEILKGDDLFEERKTLYKGVGDNFGNYRFLRAQVQGENKAAPASTFAQLGLQEVVLKNLMKCGHQEPTPIQQHGSPQLIAGFNTLCYAQTGSGKTAAFLLPVYRHLLEDVASLTPPATAPPTPEVLILAPTRELVNQIATEANMYGAGTEVNVRVIYGGASMNDQKYQLLRGCNILIATPGRLIHYLAEKLIDLSRVRMFILDESDRMLDLGFMPDVDKIVARLPPMEKRQTGMFFSARMPKDLREILANKYLKEYVSVEIGIEGGACADIKQNFLEVSAAKKKTEILEVLRKEDKKNKVLMFCGTKRGTDFLAFHISANGIPCTSIHGDRFQNQREEALRDFTYGRHQVLVASDVAARGLDIPEVELVVNYDLPADIQTYVLRIGRTGRVGHSGRALSFYDPQQDFTLKEELKEILKATGQPIPPFFDEPSIGSHKINQGQEWNPKEKAAVNSNANGEDVNDWVEGNGSDAKNERKGVEDWSDEEFSIKKRPVDDEWD